MTGLADVESYDLLKFIQDVAETCLDLCSDLGLGEYPGSSLLLGPRFRFERWPTIIYGLGSDEVM